MARRKRTRFMTGRVSSHFPITPTECGSRVRSAMTDRVRRIRVSDSVLPREKTRIQRRRLAVLYAVRQEKIRNKNKEAKLETFQRISEREGRGNRKQGKSVKCMRYRRNLFILRMGSRNLNPGSHGSTGPLREATLPFVLTTI